MTPRKKHVLVEWVVVEIDGEPPVLEGWRFIGMIEHLRDGQNIVRSHKHELNPAYREAKPTCDHCNTKRYRKLTFVVQNESGKEMRVGRSCLKDFLGHPDPNDAALCLEYYYSMLEWLEEQDHGAIADEFMSDKKKIRFGVLNALAFTLLSIRLLGWRSSQSDSESTKSIVVSAFLDKGKVFDRGKFHFPSKSDYDCAKKIIAWGETLAGKSDYQHNLSVILSQESVPYKQMGYLVSAVPAYTRKQSEVKKVATSEYVGTPRKRQVFTLTCEAVHTLEGAYGLTWLHRFTDENGNMLVWFASSKKLYKGVTYTGKATVKKHDLYNDVKQTTLTRASLSPVVHNMDEFMAFYRGYCGAHNSGECIYELDYDREQVAQHLLDYGDCQYHDEWLELIAIFEKVYQ